MWCTCTVCSALQCSICSMKCTYSDSGAFPGAGKMRNVHCAVGRVQCAEELAVETARVKLKFYL